MLLLLTLYIRYRPMQKRTLMIHDVGQSRRISFLALLHMVQGVSGPPLRRRTRPQPCYSSHASWCHAISTILHEQESVNIMLSSFLPDSWLKVWHMYQLHLVVLQYRPRLRHDAFLDKEE